MKNVIELIKERREAAKDAGFSLLELVVAVGILLVLTVGGLLAYNGITNNARQAAVDSAASEVYTAAVAYESAGQGKTAQDAASEWMASQQGGAPTGVEDETKGNIFVEVTPGSNGALEVSATNVKTGQTSERATGAVTP